MKKHINIVIFIVLFISSVSVLAILVARGYSFSDNKIKENGIVKIESKPREASIFIDNEEIAKTPDQVELEAGTHTIEIKATGYVEWKKEIDLTPSVVTEIYANLIPIEINVEQVTFTSITKAFFTDDGSYVIYYVTEDKNEGLWIQKLEQSIFDIDTSKPRQLISADKLKTHCPSKDVISLATDPENKRALIKCMNNDNSIFLLVNIDGDSILNLNQILNFSPKTVSFAYNHDTLLIQDDETISIINISNKEITLISRHKNAFLSLVTLIDDIVIVLEYNYNAKERKLYKINADLSKSEISIDKSLDVMNITDISGSIKSSIFAITSVDSTYILRLDDTKIKTIKKLSKNEISIQNWSHDGKSFTYIENGNLYSTSVDLYPEENYKIQTEQIVENYKKDNFEISWAYNSQQLVMNDIAGKTIYTIDSDGSNKTILLEEKLVEPSAFKLSVNETFLVLLLQDDSNSSNLYSLKLQI